MACDGSVAQEELDLVRHYTTTSSYFKEIDVQQKINEYVNAINSNGSRFLSCFLADISNANLNEAQEKEIVKMAVRMIQEDNKIEYSEIRFFKKIRAKLKLSDEVLLEILKGESIFQKFPEVQPEDFLLPDIIDIEDWDMNYSFESIDINIQNAEALQRQ